MIAPRDILLALRTSGYTVQLLDGQLCLSGPTGPPAPELMDLLRANRDAVVDYLAHPVTYGCVSCGRFVFPEPDFTCYWCRRALASLPLGPPCDGCGESCERCLGMEGEQP